jgi:hypothetical protein
MQPLLAETAAGTVEAVYVFAITGIVIAVLLVCAALMARRTDYNKARFYLKMAAVCCGVATVLIIVVRALGEEGH